MDALSARTKYTEHIMNKKKIEKCANKIVQYLNYDYYKTDDLIAAGLARKSEKAYVTVLIINSLRHFGITITNRAVAQHQHCMFCMVCNYLQLSLVFQT